MAFVGKRRIRQMMQTDWGKLGQGYQRRALTRPVVFG